MEDPGVNDRRWYVLQTKRKQETRAELNLRRWNVETLAPKLHEPCRARSGELSYRLAPLFPNYVFARFDSETLLTKVRLTRGIRRVIGFGEYATPIDDAVIELIRSRTTEDGIVRVPDLQPGEVVEIVHGPLQSLVGTFERHTSARERVVILLTTLACGARVEVARSVIRRAAGVAV